MPSSHFVFLIILVLLSGCSRAHPVLPPETENTPTITPQKIQTPMVELTAIDNQPENTESIFDIAVSRDKQNIAVFTPKGIYLYDSITLTQQQFIEVASTYQQKFIRFSPSITFTPNGTELIFSDKNWILSWDLVNQSENDNLFLSFSSIPEWDISQIEFSPKGDRIMVTTYGYHHRCDGTGVNFALYDIEFNLLFDQYSCTAYLENYYRFTKDNKVYIFCNASSEFFPLHLDIIDLATGNILVKETYEIYSGNPQNFIYDVNQKGDVFAVGSFQNGELVTRLVDVATNQTLQETHRGVDLSLEGVGKIRKDHSDVIIIDNCGITNKFKNNQYELLASNGQMAVLAVSDWYWSEDLRNIKSLELWDLSMCKIEKAITLP